jgi:aminotransferase
MMPINANLEPLRRSGIRIYTNMAKEVPGCVMLTLGEPDFPTPEPIKAAATAALQRNMTHYAPNQGCEDLRRAIAAYEGVSEEQVLVTVGATGAIYTALTGVLNPGDEVIVPYPAFSLYDTITTAAGGKTVRLDTAKTDFQITKPALNAAISPKTKVIVLNSPNNPTGSIYSEESLAAVKEAVLGKDIYVLCDNVYDRLAYEACPDLSHDPELQEQILLCQSFSKPWAMTGWRVGYLVAPRQLIGKLLLLHAAEVAAVPTFLQAACVTALQTDVSAMREAYRARRDYVLSRLTGMGLRCPKPAGAFYAFADISAYGLPSDEFCTRLIREGKVAAVPGSCFGADGFIRISYCCSMENLKTGLDRLEAFIQTIKNAAG